MTKILYKELSYKINGLFFETHKELGRFRNEKQYADYFEKLLKRENIKYVREYRYDDHLYGQGQVRCVVDFIIEDKIVLEFKSKEFLSKQDYMQTKRYLVTLNLELAKLVNFHQFRLAPKRVLNSDYYQLNKRK